MIREQRGQKQARYPEAQQDRPCRKNYGRMLAEIRREYDHDQQKSKMDQAAGTRAPAKFQIRLKGQLPLA